MELSCWGGGWGLPSVHSESLVVMVRPLLGPEAGRKERAGRGGAGWARRPRPGAAPRAEEGWAPCSEELRLAGDPAAAWRDTSRLPSRPPSCYSRPRKAIWAVGWKPEAGARRIPPDLGARAGLPRAGQWRACSLGWRWGKGRAPRREVPSWEPAVKSSISADLHPVPSLKGFVANSVSGLRQILWRTLESQCHR